jgi:hypothetical protein
MYASEERREEKRGGEERADVLKNNWPVASNIYTEITQVHL